MDAGSSQLGAENGISSTPLSLPDKFAHKHTRNSGLHPAPIALQAHWNKVLFAKPTFEQN